MTTPDPRQRYLDRLRQWRNRPPRDTSLGFLKSYFDREVARPHKQLGPLAELWHRLVPAELREHTRLDGLRRGVLTVSVDSSAHLFELDRLLRSGLEKQLIAEPGSGTFRKVKLRVAPMDDGEGRE